MKRVDGDKDKFNWALNDKYYYNRDKILCCLEPPFTINNRMTMVFSENDEMAVKMLSRKDGENNKLLYILTDLKCIFCKLFKLCTLLNWLKPS